MPKYGNLAKEEVHKELHMHKHVGKWKSKQQAIAVGLESARKKGGKVPPKK